MHTQTSSKARVKKDTVGEAGLQILYSSYGTQSLIEFRSLCISLIEQSTGKRETKDKFIRVFESARSKDEMLRSASNYLLAGQGLGV